MTSGVVWLVAALVASISPSADALHFILTPYKGVRGQKCFYEHLEAKELFIGRVEGMDLEETNGQLNELKRDPIQIRVEVSRDRETDAGKLVYDEDFEEVDSTFRFSDDAGGNYKICLMTADNKEKNHQDVRLSIRIAFKVDTQVGKEVSQEGVAKEEHISALVHRVWAVRNEIDYIKTKLVKYREVEAHVYATGESNNARVAWLSVFQSALLVAIGLWQICHLKAFFLEKKLV